MKQAYRILFLFLTVVFSFGFTTSESACKVNKKAVHTCCQKSEKEEAPQKCKSDCCVQTITISRFEEGIVLNTEAHQQNSIIKSTVAVNRFVASPFSNENQTASNTYLLKHLVLKIPKHAAVLTQTWLV